MSTKKREAPTEPFKRAVAGCVRAVAGKRDVEVAFAADRPLLLATKVRLPEPPRRLTMQEAAITRGLGDAMALRLACHDGKVHRRYSPEGRQARAIFDAVEQARCEALGSRRMDGVRSNLTAMLQDRYHRANLDDITEQSEAPMEDALALMVRERLTGAAPPKAARKVVELWREAIETKAGGELDRLGTMAEDQHAFAEAVRDLLTSLDMGEELGPHSDDDEDEQNDDAEASPEQSDAARGEAEEDQQESAEQETESTG
jgi:cobaltochelatase CobT